MIPRGNPVVGIFKLHSLKDSSGYCLWIKSITQPSKYFVVHGFLKIKGN